MTLNFTPFPTLTTERLVLRKFEKTDAPEVFRFRGDEKVAQYIARPVMKAMEEAEMYIEKMRKGAEENEFVQWGMTLKETNKIIGSICLWNIQKEHYRADVGYEMHSHFWGKGIMSEALKAVIDYGFNTMKLHSIAAWVDPANIASIKLLERNNFVKEAYFKESYYLKGNFVDSVVYSLLAN